MNVATRAHAQVMSYVIHDHECAGCLCGLPHCESEICHRASVAARTEAEASGAKTVLVEITPRWRPSEDEIVRAAIVVILVALLAIMALAAAAILTMG